MLLAQVLLDRRGHSPGVLDGYPGGNTTRAIKAYQKSHGMKEDGAIDAELLRKLTGDTTKPILSSYKITSKDVAGPFKAVPSTMAAMADRDALGYASPEEMLAERFHMSPGLLRALNPDTDFKQADTEVLVVAKHSESPLAAVRRIEVDKANAEVRAYGESDKLLATFPATVGSSDFPSPSGTMKVNAIAAKPNYSFQPDDQKWGGDTSLTLPPGPNNPVGSTWIDLGKEGYGIHGTPEPSKIGKTASHGCVRLTNWDAAVLAKAVIPGKTEVVFN
ncbi:L,D-transpeptidase family protein [Novosphingobium aquimarinum]|uniref:L,D-transpeptidase family protein n=1 Tax=Novosphingobium aquimarinum TaxID=2682494 RepID=UPI0012EB716E|nr:L,D-transpeptidase [Novosphingobium aquimarinum]